MICNSRHAGNQNKSSSSNETTSSEKAVLHSYTSLPDKGVLLKITIATVSSASHLQTEANIFDEGAQQSLAEELELIREGTETISLSSFDSTSNKVQQVDFATVHVITDLGSGPDCANDFNAYQQQIIACSLRATISPRS